MTEEFCQTFREELMPIFLKLCQKIPEERTFPNSFYEAIITLIPKQDRENKTKKTNKQNPSKNNKWKPQANITDENRCKNPQQSFSKQNSATHQKADTPWSSWVYSRNARIFQYTQINVIHYINKLKDHFNRCRKSLWQNSAPIYN